jgi:hypothetical protein
VRAAARAAIIVALLALPRHAATQSTPAVPTAPDEPTARWSARLEALDPARPMEYFLLAEEVADAAAASSGSEALTRRALARQLFGLSAVLASADLVGAGRTLGLDEAKLTRSAALALADLAEDPGRAARLRTAAALLDRRGGTLLASPLATPPGDPQVGGQDGAAALALSEALSLHRRGQGPKVTRLLAHPGVAELLDAHGSMIDGGADRLREDARAYRGQARPSMKEGAVTALLHLELGVLAGRDRPWSTDLRMTRDQPLAEVDLTRLDELLEVDPSRPFWRSGRWVDRTQAGSRGGSESVDTPP